MTALRVDGGTPAGCVLRIDTGVAVVLTDLGVRRAGYGARMLAAVARDRRCAPEAGDWVRLRSWPDGRTTLEECLTRPPAPEPPGAEPPGAEPPGAEPPGAEPSGTVLAFPSGTS